MKRLNSIFLCLVAWVLMLTNTSCLESEDATCGLPPNSVRIYFNFADQPSGYAATPIDPTEIKQMHLFVFDAQGVLVKEIEEDNILFSETYFISLNIEPGTYTFVAWGNLKNDYQYTITPQQQLISMADMTVNVKTDDMQIVTSPITSLYYAHQQTAQITGLTNQTFTLPLQQNTNTIRVTTEGLPASLTDYNLQISDTNGHYTFDNSFAPNAPQIYYKTNCIKGLDAQLSASLNVLKLAEERKIPILKIESTDKTQTLYQANLIELILKLKEKDPTINFDTTHRYDILLKFNVDMTVTVSVNGWELNTEVTEL